MASSSKPLEVLAYFGAGKHICGETRCAFGGKYHTIGNNICHHFPVIFFYGQKSRLRFSRMEEQIVKDLEVRCRLAFEPQVVLVVAAAVA